MAALDQITLKGFKSIRELKDFKLEKLNVLVGANGAGKSNLVDFFRMLRAMADRRVADSALVSRTGRISLTRRTALRLRSRRRAGIRPTNAGWPFWRSDLWHEVAHQVEHAIVAELPLTTVLVHLEPEDRVREDRFGEAPLDSDWNGDRR